MLGYCRICGGALIAHDIIHGPRDGSCYRCAMEHHRARYTDTPSVEDTHDRVSFATQVEAGAHRRQARRVARAVRRART